MAGPATIDCVDRFGRRPHYLRISITGRCNLRCRYCAPEYDLPYRANTKDLSDSEILRLIGLFARLGARKVRFTGGEPLLRQGLPNLLRGAKAIDGIDQVALTTNGWFLESQLDALVDAGLESVNISCDTLDPETFRQITGRRGLGRVRSAIDRALAHPRIGRVKLNVVVMRGINDDEVGDFLSFCTDPKIHVRFIEFMPTADIEYSRDLVVTEAEIRERLGVALKPIDSGDPSAPATLWALPDHPGRIGFISTMSHKFCDTCSRIRVTADGQLANCLFSDSLLDLKELLRKETTDDEIIRSVTAYWRGKSVAHALDEPSFNARPAMITVGG
jgi:cyclic pyranopterin phosphate synthase